MGNLSSSANLEERQTDPDCPTTTAEKNQAASREDLHAILSDEVLNQAENCVTSPSLPITEPGLPSLASEVLDNSDDSEGEFFCSAGDHLEKIYMDEVFNISIDTVFLCLFTASAFCKNFMGSRQTFDLNLPNWKKEPDEHGNKIRNISYTLTLNNSIGPKTSPTTEKQICYAMSRPGRIYHVDCECCNGGIPYADSFYVLLRYCLTRVSPSKCRVVITGELKYRKYIMGMFKGMIEKGAVNGLTEHCTQLSIHLRREAERQEAIAVGHPISVPKKKLGRRRGKLGPSLSDSGVGFRQPHPETQTSTPPSPSKSGYFCTFPRTNHVGETRNFSVKLYLLFFAMFLFIFLLFLCS